MSPEYELGNPWKRKPNTLSEVPSEPSTSGYVLRTSRSNSESGTAAKNRIKDEPATGISTNSSINNDTGSNNIQSKLPQTNATTFTPPPVKAEFDSQPTSTGNSEGQSQETVQLDSDDSEEFGEITDDDSEDEDEQDEDFEEVDFVRQHGLGSQHYRLSIEINDQVVELVETNDNTDLLAALKEQCVLMEKKYLPMIQKWLEVGYMYILVYDDMLCMFR